MLELFNLYSLSKNHDTDILTLNSPLGKVSLEVFMNGITLSKIPPQLHGTVSNHAYACSWNSKDIHIELLKTSMTPKLPQGMAVTSCIAYLWRFKVLSKEMELKFTCRLSLNDPSLEREPESGESLIAQSWGYDTARITIGTEDEEALLSRARNQTGIPLRLADDKILIPETIDYLKDGIQIKLPSFLEEEEGQVQFVIAWSEKGASDDISTWYAVDTSYKEIIQSATKTTT